RMIDEIDGRILNILQSNSRTSNAEIARQVGLAPSAVFERLRKLEERGVIRGYSVNLDPRAMEVPLVCFIFVRSSERVGSPTTAASLGEIPEVLEIHHVAGEDCFLLKVRAADTEAVGRLLREKFGKIPSITSTRTTIVLETVKETAALPIPAAEEEPEARSA
ncbi:MAG TPA: Lrp/AsnC family transcriptional regulator, partial [Thermoanaerobaculia bacterium]|nr:Lrp/AsnC family transcriptional regulator [Thermoanaerobaculia bacterium]